MKNLTYLNEDIKKKVSPLIDYLDQYYSYNEELSNENKTIYYGSKSDYIKMDVSNEKLTITYSNYMSCVFVKQNYPLAVVENDSITFNYDHPLPYILIYVTFDKSLDI